MRLGQFSPVVILLEPAAASPREFKGISPTRLAMLNKLWVKPEPVPGGPKIGFTPLDVMNPTHGTFPTAQQLAADNGFNIEHLPEDTRFENLDVVMYSHPRLECRNPDELLDFVRNGGGLLMMGSGALTYHVMPGNKKIMKELGVEQAYIPLQSESESPGRGLPECPLPDHSRPSGHGKCRGIRNRQCRSAHPLSPECGRPAAGAEGR